MDRLFGLADVPALSRSTVERDDEVRKDESRLDELWTTGQVLLIDRKGRTPVRLLRAPGCPSGTAPPPGSPGPAEDAVPPPGPAGSAADAAPLSTSSDPQAGASPLRDAQHHAGGPSTAAGTASETGRQAAAPSGGGEAGRLSLGQTAQAVDAGRAGSAQRGIVALGLRAATDLGADRPADAVLLGARDGVGYWAVPADEAMTGEAAPPPNSWGLWAGARSTTGEEWHDLRAIGGLLDDTAAGLFTTAVALQGWHARARFCAGCGSPVRRTAAGWASTCTGCGREEYPRTDPAVICLVHDGVGVNGERVLLARQPVWPPERYSVLAGFVEAGESLEACVEREVAEEVGVAVRGIRYLGSQPWPFPRSVMIAFAAQADPDAPLRLAAGEIEDARWVSRDQVRAALAACGEVPGLRLPGSTSIAGQMIEAWAGVDAR